MDVKSPAAADSISRRSSALSASAEPSRVVIALRRAGIALTGVGVAALTGAACVLSFDDLRALAIVGEAPSGLAYLYPAAFDALLVIAMISVLLLGGGRWPARLQAGVILALLFTGAASAEVTTAVQATLNVRRAAVVVAVAPWVMLIVGLWLWLLLINHAAARRASVDAALADLSHDIVPFSDTDLPTAEYPAQPARRDQSARRDQPAHPGRPIREDQQVHPLRAVQRDRAVRPDERDRTARPVPSDEQDRTTHPVHPGQLVHHPAAEIMLDPQAAPPLESATRHDLPAGVPAVGPTSALETPEVTEVPSTPIPTKPVRWGDLVRPRQGDLLVHPPRPAAQESEKESDPGYGSRISERVETWDASTDLPEGERVAEVGDRDADTQPHRVMTGRAADRVPDEAAGTTDEVTASSIPDPDPAHGAEAADAGEGAGSEEDTVAPPSGRMRSTPTPPGE